MRSIILAQTGQGFVLKTGQRLRVIDLEGEQVADLFCFSQADPRDTLSAGRSIDYEDTLYFTRGHKLYSFSGKPMLEIVADDCGQHDFTVTPCSAQMFEMISGKPDPHPSCQENLERAFRQLDVDESRLGTTFNIFMNVQFNGEGRLQLDPPKSKAGDAITFVAKMDLVVGLTACSDEGTNHGRCKPIAFEILPPA